MRWRYVTGALLILVLCGIGGYSLGWHSVWAWVISGSFFVAAVALADGLVMADHKQRRHDAELARRVSQERGDAW